MATADFTDPNLLSTVGARVPYGERMLLQNFTDSLADMNINPAYFSGSILVAGGGYSVPERTFFCTPETNYTQPQDGITKVICIDKDNQWAIKGNLGPIKVAGNQEAWLGEFIVGSEEKFNVITFLRIPDFANQLDLMGWDRIFSSLVPGGYFIGSGSMLTASGEAYSIFTFIALAEYYGMELVSYTALPWLDESGFSYGRNAGVILRKKEVITK